MTDEQIQNLIHMNQRLSIVLGYASAFICDYGKLLPNSEKDKYNWLMDSIENLFYLDKPLPPMP